MDNSDSDDTPEALDEEGEGYQILASGGTSLTDKFLEQEKLIAKMRAENQERNDEYLVTFKTSDIFVACKTDVILICRGSFSHSRSSHQ